jgi:hypothetical protein
MSPAMSADGPNESWTVCTCNNCSGHLEFDASRAGESVQCPLCGTQTVLFIPEVQVESAPPVRIRVAAAPPKPASAAVSAAPERYQEVEESGVAFALSVIATLELVAAPLAGLAAGFQSASLGWTIAVSGVLSGLISLGLAKVVEYTHESAQRLRRIERLLQEAKDNKK